MRLPDSMPVAVYRGTNAISLETRPVPVPGSGEVVVEVSHCGVCGSDLHFVIEGWGRPGAIGGHEYSGRVAAVGPGVAGWAVGDPVVGGAMVGCGTCVACRAGRPSLCRARSSPGVGDLQGAFAGFVSCPAAELVRVPEGLPLRTAALTEPLAVALHGITAAALAPGQRALVTGAGPIGLLTVAALRARGVDDVTVSEPAPLRRELARNAKRREIFHFARSDGVRMNCAAPRRVQPLRAAAIPAETAAKFADGVEVALEVGKRKIARRMVETFFARFAGRTDGKHARFERLSSLEAIVATDLKQTNVALAVI